MLEIGRQARPELYRPCARGPAPLVPAELRFEVDERVAPEGVTRPLDDESLEEVLRRVADAAPEAVAVCLLHSYVDPGHERTIAARAARARFPACTSPPRTRCCACFREYERTSTTVIDAYLSPLIGRYLERLGARAAERGLPAPEIMSSGGGLIDAGAAAPTPPHRALGAGRGRRRRRDPRRLAGAEHVLSFDMGGTSTRRLASSTAATSGRPPARPSRGAFSSFRWSTCTPSAPAAAASAGPTPAGRCASGRSRPGADPGPACYGLGGTLPTVTDANLLLGYLGTEGALAGGVALDAEAAARAVDGLAAATRPRPRGRRAGDRAGRRPRDGAGAARRHCRARGRSPRATRSSHSAARGRCTPRASPRSSRSGA